jgi:hypothetical protein
MIHAPMGPDAEQGTPARRPSQPKRTLAKASAMVR